jgi:hypothetical protein
MGKQTFSAKPAAAVIIWRTHPRQYPYVSTEWGVRNAFYLDVMLKAVTGTMYARLWDKTAAAAVTGSQISTTESDWTRVRSSALALTSGNEYRVQTGLLASDQGMALLPWILGT